MAPTFSLCGCVMSGHTATTAGRRGQVAGPGVRVGTFSNGIAYDVTGSGSRTVIFLPGGPGIVRMAWARIARTLLEPLAAGGCTVWRLARRRDMPEGHTLADMADDVAQVIDEGFGGHVYAVVGLSMGGMIAQFLAARHPEVMDRVVLISAAAVPTPEVVESTRREGEALGHGRYREAGAAFFEDVLPGDRLRFLRRLLGVPIARMLARSGNNPPDVLVETAAVMDVDTRPVLPRITVPVLLIRGDKDRDFTSEMVEETVRLIPDCTLIRYENRGHGGAAWDKRTPAHILDFVYPTRWEVTGEPFAIHRSIHIDAPVKQVFAHVKEPTNFVAADPEPVELTNLSLTPEGVGSTWETSWRALGRHLHGAWTRQECIPNERIVDRVSTGARWAFTTTPDTDGTTLTVAFGFTTRSPLANKIIRWALASQNRQLDRMLANYKQSIEP